MSTLSQLTPARGTAMKNRYFWGMPHTETGVEAFKTALVGRAEAVSAGQFAAVSFVEKALEHLVRRSSALLLVDTLFTIVTMLLTYKMAADQGEPGLWLLGLAARSGSVRQ